VVGSAKEVHTWLSYLWGGGQALERRLLMPTQNVGFRHETTVDSGRPCRNATLHGTGTHPAPIKL
jgi:hypothetical protein